MSELKRIAGQLRRAGASIPAPENKGTIESAMATGLSIALVLVEDAIDAEARAGESRKPMTDEEIEEAYRRVYRSLPDGFGHSAIDWIEAGIRYAERIHGITDTKGEQHG